MFHYNFQEKVERRRRLILERKILREELKRRYEHQKEISEENERIECECRVLREMIKRAPKMEIVQKSTDGT